MPLGELSPLREKVFARLFSRFWSELEEKTHKCQKRRWMFDKSPFLFILSHDDMHCFMCLPFFRPFTARSPGPQRSRRWSAKCWVRKKGFRDNSHFFHARTPCPMRIHSSPKPQYGPEENTFFVLLCYRRSRIVLFRLGRGAKAPLIVVFRFIISHPERSQTVELIRFNFSNLHPPESKNQTGLCRKKERTEARKMREAEDEENLLLSHFVCVGKIKTVALQILGMSLG